MYNIYRNNQAFHCDSVKKEPLLRAALSFEDSVESNYLR